MPRQPLADVIAAYRRFDLTVQVVPGAETRGDPAFNPGCHVGHHTAGPRTGDRPSLAVVVNGRPDLDGPLAQDFLTRSGVVCLVATGRANHAGLGGFRGIVGNSGASGTEAEDDGDGLWTPEQEWAWPRVVAARLWLIGRDASWYCSHRTWALTPPSWPGRKIDPAGIEDQRMRAAVAPLLANPNAAPLEADVPLTVAELDAIESRCRTAVRSELNLATPQGSVSWAASYPRLVGKVEQLINMGNAETARDSAEAARDAQLAAAITDLPSAVLAVITADEDTASWTDAQRAELAADVAARVSAAGFSITTAAVHIAAETPARV